MRSKRGLITLMVLLAGCTVGPKSAFADIFDFTIDTSGVSGTTGGIYLQFNPGLASLPASVSINNFVISGAGGLLSGTPPGGFPAGTDGDVSGSLDNLPLTLRNTTALNDYLQYMTFGDSIAFQLAFNLPSPLGGDPSSFGLEITGPDGLSSVFPVDSNFFNVEMTFDSTGNIVSTNRTSLITITPAAVPEPASVVLLTTALAGLLIGRRCKVRF